MCHGTEKTYTGHCIQLPHQANNKTSVLGERDLLSYTPFFPMPLHPKSREFAKSGLFAGVKSFEQLEKRIAAIPPNHGSKGNGDAFLKF